MNQVFFCSFCIMLLGCEEYPRSRDPSYVQPARDRALCDDDAKYSELDLKIKEDWRRLDEARAHDAPTVCDNWMMVPSKRRYRFDCMGNGPFHLIDMKDGQSIGTGVQTGDTTRISMQIDMDGQPLNLKVILSSDGPDALVGTLEEPFFRET